MSEIELLQGDAKSIEMNKIYNEDCLEGMKRIKNDSIDLTVTSPPYDKLRNYGGFSWDFEGIVKELYRVTKEGGIVVWVVADATVKGDETGTSFRQALFFKETGFRLHDTMIYQKKNTPFMRSNAYTHSFEYMFIFSKGSPKTFNPLKVPTVRSGREKTRSNKDADGNVKVVTKELKKEKNRTNIWSYAVGMGGTTRDKIAFKHPAVFPESLAEDHILSWSNEGDVVMDIFMGSGTTAKMAMLNNRNFIGFELNKDYCDIASQRVKRHRMTKTTKQED